MIHLAPPVLPECVLNVLSGKNVVCGSRPFLVWPSKFQVNLWSDGDAVVKAKE